jgi:acetoacetyl-CoA synthetase
MRSTTVLVARDPSSHPGGLHAPPRPGLVLEVDDLPRTRSGKLVELAVADRVNGREVRNTSALSNPEALDAIAALPPLRPAG